LQAYDRKIEDNTDELMRMIEQQVMLHAVNDHWMTHLQMVEYIREGIGLRGYGQVDPLVAYKRETFDLFQTTLKNIRDQAVRTIYRAQIQREAPAQAEPESFSPEPMMMRMEDEPEASSAGGAAVATATASTASLANVDWKKVGRNDPCPCGSGKKFKSCHYPQLRADGVI